MTGSIAAGVQAGIGNVVAGSAFAILQSAGAGGAGAAIVGGAVQAAGIIGVATTAVRARRDNNASEAGIEEDEV